MKKFLLTLIVAAFAACPMVAQNANTAVQSHQVVKHECKDHKDGQACNKPADQQCNDCKAKAAAAHQCDKAEGMKKCDKAEGTKCQKTAAMKHECKDHKDGQACNKPADQQCNDCKAKAAAKKN